MLDNYKVCCICGKTFEGYGNDPWPVKEEGRCCDECNYDTVIPARISQLRSAEEKEINENAYPCVNQECLWNTGNCECVCPGDRDKLNPDSNACEYYAQD